ncbi:Expansin-a16 [Thalictrum thalictroides]|uniref:Expansin-a16 n=1 Tax=Thalictrum thalictroides TaxID=46969 RepID=A0A7J6WCA7_THATH|nr:Expansin-a16 [Thalictrum thalictroides]
MASFQAKLCYYLTFFKIIGIIAASYSSDEWKSATATYTKESDGSLITEGACGYGDLHRISYGRHSAGLSGSPSIIVTATDFCPPNYGLANDYGGWCNFPRQHFEMSEMAFAEIATRKADIVQIQYRRVNCDRSGGIRFTIMGTSYFYQVLITNVGLDGVVASVKVKGSRTGWLPMGRNWGQIWQCNTNLQGQPLSFEVTTSSGRSITSYNVAPKHWQFGQTFEGKQF